MELYTVRSAWQEAATPSESSRALKAMMREGSHPVLKRIRRQLIIETVAFILFLVVYYDFFDGHQKPLLTNLLLIAAMALNIIHNMMVYRHTKSPMRGLNLVESLQKQLDEMKSYAVASVISRALVAGCLLLFFATTISFTPAKYWILAGIILLFAMQVILLSIIWTKRIRQLKSTIGSLR